MTPTFLVQAHVKIAHLFLYAFISNMTTDLYRKCCAGKRRMWLHSCDCTFVTTSCTHCSSSWSLMLSYSQRISSVRSRSWGKKGNYYSSVQVYCSIHLSTLKWLIFAKKVGKIVSLLSSLKFLSIFCLTKKTWKAEPEIKDRIQK